MNARFPLSFKIFAWAVLNLAVIGIVFMLLFQSRYEIGLESLFGTNTRKRITEISRIISAELNSRPQSEWHGILNRFKEVYGVDFFLFRCNGAQVAGNSIVLPESVVEQLSSIRGGAGMGQGRGAGRGAMRMMDREPLEPAYFFHHDSNTDEYWIGVRMYSIEKLNPQGGGLALIVNVKSIFKSSLFDTQPLLLTAGIAILFSLLFWIPFLRNITQAIKNTTLATEKISHGDFSIRVKSRRRDELGVLSDSVNKLAERLEGFVSGQKRFLGDVSHELCSPLARIEMALGILERNASADQLRTINEIREDLMHISLLIKELLSYSRIGLKEKEVKLQRVAIKTIIDNAIKREKPNGVTIVSNVSENVIGVLEPELFERAISNLIRNAIQYAGQCGEIEISATSGDKETVIIVADHGPGVPENELEKIFDPFYRVEKSRSRDYGGAGLGLAIARAAIHACGGNITARNRSPNGLIVEIRLKNG